MWLRIFFIGFCVSLTGCASMADYANRPVTQVTMPAVAFDENTRFYGLSSKGCGIEEEMNATLQDKDELYALNLIADKTDSVPSYSAKLTIQSIKNSFDPRMFPARMFYTHASGTPPNRFDPFPNDFNRFHVQIRYTIEAFKDGISLDKRAAYLSDRDDDPRCRIATRLASSAARDSLRWLSDTIEEDKKSTTQNSSEAEVDTKEEN